MGVEERGRGNRKQVDKGPVRELKNQDGPGPQTSESDLSYRRRKSREVYIAVIGGL